MLKYSNVEWAANSLNTSSRLGSKTKNTTGYNILIIQQSIIYRAILAAETNNLSIQDINFAQEVPKVL